ncbi:MAG: hypothetical protein KGJ74_15605 [Betaproteobacteria bacterium]|nr:hypothetical protein [Betaproteobacteria bacterium]
MDGRIFPLLAALACAGLPPGSAQAADAAPSAAASAAQPSWTNAGHSFTVQLIQLGPDNVRAFYDNMGYPPKAIDAIAKVCVFGTSIHNQTKVSITYDVADWRAVTPDGQQHPLITKTQWLARWKELGLSSDWSILPPQQTLQPGDWAQGFTTVDLPRGARFKLVYFWKEHGTQRRATLAGPQCAAGTRHGQP